MIVPIEESLVRNNTIPPTITCVKESHAKEVHIWATLSPVRFPCLMRINIYTKEKLIANKFEHLTEYPGANSTMYLSVEVLVSSVWKGIKVFKIRKCKSKRSWLKKMEIIWNVLKKWCLYSLSYCRIPHRIGIVALWCFIQYIKLYKMLPPSTEPHQTGLKSSIVLHSIFKVAIHFDLIFI